MSSVHLMEVSDGVFEAVIRALNYSSINSINTDVENIKKWMEKQPHFPEIIDDKRIQNFLILNKGSIKKSKKKIDNYYTVRSLLPEIFDEVNPKLPYINCFLESNYFVPLPKLTKEMYRVFVYKFRKTYLPKNYDFVHILRYLINLQELRLVEDVMYGDVVIIDGEGIPINILLHLTPTIIYKMVVNLYQNVYSMRFKAMYVVNAPPFVEKILLILKTMLKPKILARIHFCPNIDFVQERLGKEILPKDYGGEEKSMHELQQMVIQKFKEHEKHFDELDGFRIKENLRPQELRNDKMFGFYGNFKKLEVD